MICWQLHKSENAHNSRAPPENAAEPLSERMDPLRVRCSRTNQKPDNYSDTIPDRVNWCMEEYFPNTRWMAEFVVFQEWNVSELELVLALLIVSEETREGIQPTKQNVSNRQFRVGSYTSCP